MALNCLVGYMTNNHEAPHRNLKLEGSGTGFRIWGFFMCNFLRVTYAPVVRYDGMTYTGIICLRPPSICNHLLPSATLILPHFLIYYQATHDSYFSWYPDFVRLSTSWIYHIRIHFHWNEYLVSQASKHKAYSREYPTASDKLSSYSPGMNEVSYGGYSALFTATRGGTVHPPAETGTPTAGPPEAPFQLLVRRRIVVMKKPCALSRTCLEFKSARCAYYEVRAAIRRAIGEICGQPPLQDASAVWFNDIYPIGYHKKCHSYYLFSHKKLQALLIALWSHRPLLLSLTIPPSTTLLENILLYIENFLTTY
ncbi:uncharacterized protein BDR25DRAFT_351206 [Lindgomyces ingoldianus]|uniref:Uncharacterized protein n=1 Tax=Lindgomyces ingoldianus TaxID=673940 RepID=A0ACB6R8N3_9PLEO|nr:uncharacterized protein BDR25DRAFT_351206 [Lindgomyces ingoldianus]KAF2474682.1 hypothetical protein BDR25DRAFT_351206 [Lindgomyces ingoldianus]